MLWDCQIVSLSVRESNFWECLWIQAMLCRSRPALSAAHTHTGVIPNPAKKKKAQNCAFSLFLFPFSSNLSSILISPTKIKFLLAFQMLISSFVIVDLKSTIVPVPLICFFPPTFQAADRLISVSYIFGILERLFWSLRDVWGQKSNWFWNCTSATLCSAYSPPLSNESSLTGSITGWHTARRTIHQQHPSQWLPSPPVTLTSQYTKISLEKAPHPNCESDLDLKGSFCDQLRLAKANPATCLNVPR